MSLHILPINRVFHEKVGVFICFDNINIKSNNYKKSDFTVGLFTFIQSTKPNEQIIYKLYKHL
jgi:hypothetical protein